MNAHDKGRKEALTSGCTLSSCLNHGDSDYFWKIGKRDSENFYKRYAAQHSFLQGWMEVWDEEYKKSQAYRYA